MWACVHPLKLNQKEKYWQSHEATGILILWSQKAKWKNYCREIRGSFTESSAYTYCVILIFRKKIYWYTFQCKMITSILGSLHTSLFSHCPRPLPTHPSFKSCSLSHLQDLAIINFPAIKMDMNVSPLV